MMRRTSTPDDIEALVAKYASRPSMDTEMNDIEDLLAKYSVTPFNASNKNATQEASGVILTDDEALAYIEREIKGSRRALLAMKDRIKEVKSENTFLNGNQSTSKDVVAQLPEKSGLLLDQSAAHVSRENSILNKHTKNLQCQVNYWKDRARKVEVMPLREQADQVLQAHPRHRKTRSLVSPGRNLSLGGSRPCSHALRRGKRASALEAHELSEWDLLVAEEDAKGGEKK